MPAIPPRIPVKFPITVKERSLFNRDKDDDDGNEDDGKPNKPKFKLPENDNESGKMHSKTEVKEQMASDEVEETEHKIIKTARLRRKRPENLSILECKADCYTQSLLQGFGLYGITFFALMMTFKKIPKRIMYGFPATVSATFNFIWTRTCLDMCEK